MDVFIPEEYGIIRRMERQANSVNNGKRNGTTNTNSSKMATDSGRSCIRVKEMKKDQSILSSSFAKNDEIV